MTKLKTPRPLALSATALAAACWLAVPNAFADLVSKTIGEAPNTVDVLYDTVLKVTWIKDANLFNTLYLADPSIIQTIIGFKPTFSDPYYSNTDRANSGTDYGDSLYHLTLESPDGNSPGDFNTYGGSPFPVTGVMTHFGARAFVQWLNDQHYGGFSDWRLPKVSSAFLTCGFKLPDVPTNDGSSDQGFWITSPKSELSHLYYVTLQNSVQDKQGQPTNAPFNPGAFVNLQQADYWYRTDDLAVPGSAWGFTFESGNQGPGQTKTNTRYVLVLRDGDITDPDNPQPDLDQTVNPDSNPCINDPPVLTTTPDTGVDSRKDFEVGQVGTVGLSATDVENQEIAFTMKSRLPGLTYTADSAKGSLTGAVTWTPPAKFADKKAVFSVQATETTKTDHTEAKKVLLKSAPVPVYVRVFPAGKNAANGTRLVKVTKARWDAANSKLKVEGTVAPLRILTADEVTALFATEHAVTLDTVKSDNSKEAIAVDPPISVSTVKGLGKWTAEVSSLTNPPCRIAANFTGTASKAKAVSGAPKATCTK